MICKTISAARGAGRCSTGNAGSVLFVSAPREADRFPKAGTWRKKGWETVPILFSARSFSVEYQCIFLRRRTHTAAAAPAVRAAARTPASAVFGAEGCTGTGSVTGAAVVSGAAIVSTGCVSAGCASVPNTAEISPSTKLPLRQRRIRK